MPGRKPRKSTRITARKAKGTERKSVDASAPSEIVYDLGKEISGGRHPAKEPLFMQAMFPSAPVRALRRDGKLPKRPVGETHRHQ